MPYKFCYKYLTCALLLVSVSTIAHAQENIIQKAVKKLESANNFSYKTIKKLRQYNTDTVTSYHTDFFVKAPNDKTIGYTFSMESSAEDGSNRLLRVYNGKEQITVNIADSTYRGDKVNPSIMQTSVLGYLKMLEGLSGRKPVTALKDTVVNAINCRYLLITSYDTVIDNEHYYTRINVFTDRDDKPVSIQTLSRNKNTGDAVTNYFSSFDYFDLKIDQTAIDLTSYKPPLAFHLPNEKPVLPLLKAGVTAPQFEVTDLNGNKMNIADLKGKVILLDFFYIGCEGGMVSIKPLNDIYNKYKQKGLVVVGLSDVDSKKAINTFKTNYDIPYQMFGDAKEAFLLYHVSASPTFFFIDKNGKIAEVILGYNNDFKDNATAILDKFLVN